MNSLTALVHIYLCLFHPLPQCGSPIVRSLLGLVGLPCLNLLIGLMSSADDNRLVTDANLVHIG